MSEIIVMKPTWRYWSCAIVTFVMFSSTLCSTLFILAMTFERFYSIIQPHKAASFNAVKRARIVIISIVLFSTLDNIPHLFTSDNKGTNCLPYAKARGHIYGEIYYWVCNFINFFFPCVLLVIMNSIIIQAIRKRSLMKAARSQNQGQIQNSNRKNSEKQTYTMLLLVTFGFILLTSPAYAFMIYTTFVNFEKSPVLFAGFHFFLSTAQKLYYTNFGINFCFYVLSGQKFRRDLVGLFSRCCPKKGNNINRSIASISDETQSINVWFTD